MPKSTSKCNEQVLWDKVTGTSDYPSKNSLSVRPCRGDGNCCFRAFSDQLYGNQVHHLAIRRYAVLLMRLYSDHFAPFVASSTARSFEDYLNQINSDSVWVDDMELQAVSMLYRTPIEVYDGNMDMMRTLHEDSRKGNLITIPFRIMYHLSHYSSLRKKGEPFPLIPDRLPGEVETWSLREHKRSLKHIHDFKEQNSSTGEKGSSSGEDYSSESVYTDSSDTVDSSRSSGSLHGRTQSDSITQSHNKHAALYSECESFSSKASPPDYSSQQRIAVSYKIKTSNYGTIKHPIGARFFQYAYDDWWLTGSSTISPIRPDVARNSARFGVPSSAYHSCCYAPFANHKHSYEQSFSSKPRDSSCGYYGLDGWGRPSLPPTSQLSFPCNRACGSKNPFRNY